jgi:hypothetical protein
MRLARSLQRMGMRLILPLLLLILLAALPRPAQALGVVPDCETMAAEAGRRAGLPAGLLPAISRIEAGRGKGGERRAWPWTLNHAGKGLYFETRAEAMTYLREATVRGRTNIDVGCMQVNHYWHGANFASLDAMMNPETNIAYAVRFLKELHDRHGSWAAAVRHYHSPDPQRGERYLAAFSRAHDMILADPGKARTTSAALAAGGGGVPAVPARARAPGEALVAGARNRADIAHDVHALAAALSELAEARGAPSFDLGNWHDFAEADLSRLSPRVRHRGAEVAAFRAELAAQGPGATP